MAALVCEYLDWASMEQTLKVYMAECDLVRLLRNPPRPGSIAH